MAVSSTMLTIPMVLPKLQRADARGAEVDDRGDAAHAPGVA
jgi:hypothetical protein